MAKMWFSPDEVVTKLRQIEVLMGEGKSLQQAVREAGITDATDYRWHKEYGGLKNNQAKRLKELERENARLNKRVADLPLEKAILKEAQIVIERWRGEYNTLRPHSSLGYHPPAPAAHGAKPLMLEQPQLMQ